MKSLHLEVNAGFCEPMYMQRGKGGHASPRLVARAAMPAAAASPARVPSRLMAPSVPRGTRRSVVLRKVVFP